VKVKHRLIVMMIRIRKPKRIRNPGLLLKLTIRGLRKVKMKILMMRGLRMIKKRLRKRESIRKKIKKIKKSDCYHL